MAGAVPQLIDRSPVSARFAFGAARVRYELTADGLLIEAVGGSGRLVLRLDPATLTSVVEPSRGAAGRVLVHDLVFDFEGGLGLLIRPGALS